MGELQAGKSPFKTESNYDNNLKIWSGGERRTLFSTDLSIGEIIFRQMERHPKLIAQISVTEETVLTWEELHMNAKRVAIYMRKLGLEQGDFVGIIGRLTTHLTAVAYACFFNGTPYHALHTEYDESTIERLFGISRPRLIFCDGDDFEKVQAATEDLQIQIITMRNHPEGSLRIQDILRIPVGQNFQPVRLKDGTDQTLAILSSSGTSGNPKAVTISNSQQIIASFVPLSSSDILYNPNTLDWASGITMTVNAGVFSTTSIIEDSGFNPGALCSLIKKYKISFVFLSSSQLAMLANCPEFESADLSSLRFLTYGGSNCSLDVQKQVRRRLCRDCLNFSYTLTELNGPGCMNFNFDEKPNSVGRPVRGIKVKIIDKQGVAQGPNNLGEICIYNGQNWSGYYKNPGETKKMQDSKNWFHTGDLGYMDEDGYLFIIDRLKDMLKYQTIMYYPSEIENVIAEMPNVVEACVFGIWDPVNGDEAAASVVKKPGTQLEAQEVVDHVKKRITTKFKQLNGGALIVDRIVQSGNRKTNRAATKAEFIKIMKKNTL
ncbi:4-coumarate--CoA ligase 1 [Drosophila rhopaloa]|uniref:4-coumarate--CoA ligase 1 n=1 Tax=Drosophila rhopaloa TaxID=1041015 RepID=A0A6P4F7N0_DRORH|nr:4-coumarate--CoA ligase 1 [Drosophila rhopaloa]